MQRPTSGIFAGEHNFHSHFEWISTHDTHKAVEVIIELCRVWEEEGPGSFLYQDRKGTAFFACTFADKGQRIFSPYRSRWNMVITPSSGAGRVPGFRREVKMGFAANTRFILAASCATQAKENLRP